MNIWSLTDKKVICINYPKFSDKGICFSINGHYMALIEIHEEKDKIGIYYVGTFSLINHFPLDMSDAIDLEWSKDNSCLIIWENILECKFIIYTPLGEKIFAYNSNDLLLAIKSVSQSPNGLYLAVGFNDEICRFFNQNSWKLIKDFDHNIPLNEINSINVFKEEEQTKNHKFIDPKFISSCIYPFNAKLN